MRKILISIVLTIILLGVIVFLHEFGHFITAKYYKMPVFEFAIGMGPRIFSRNRGETTYSIRALPFGGFVNIGGMSSEEFDENSKNYIPENELTEQEKIERQLSKENGFYKKSAWQRFVVLIAGVVMNFFTAILAIFILSNISGTVPKKYTKPIIYEVQSDSNAINILQKNDLITEINGVKIKNWSELNLEISKINKNNYKGTPLSVKVNRNGKVIDNKIALKYNESAKTYILGIKIATQKATFFEKIKYSFVIFFEYFSMMLKGLKLLVTGKVPASQVTGPVGLPKVVGQTVKTGGTFAFIQLFVLLSINIGIMNLIPIPALDGGRILFVLPEFIGIKMNKRIEEKIHVLGMIFLLVIMALIVFSDVFKYF